MSSQPLIKVFFHSDYQSKDALMRAYRNEDYVAHYHEIHPARPLSVRWPFALIRQLWQALGDQRRSRLSTDRIGSMSSHLLADIGAGSFAFIAADESRTEDQLQLIKARQAQAWAAMAALSGTPKSIQLAAPELSLTDVAIQVEVARPRRSWPVSQNKALGPVVSGEVSPA